MEKRVQGDGIDASDLVLADSYYGMRRESERVRNEILAEPDGMHRLFVERDLGRYASLLLTLEPDETRPAWERIIVDDLWRSSETYRSPYQRKGHKLDAARPVARVVSEDYVPDERVVASRRLLSDRRAFRAELDTLEGNRQLVGTLSMNACLHRDDVEELRKIAAAGRAAEALLELANVSLVFHVANKFRSAVRFSFEERVEAGIEGLRHAVRTFDVSLGMSFSSLATPAIGGYILTAYTRETARQLGLSFREVRQLTAVLKTEGFLSSELGRTPTAGEITTHLATNEVDIDAKQVEKLQTTYRNRRHTSLSVVSPDTNACLVDWMETDVMDDTDDQAAVSDALDKAFAAIGLTQRQRTILYGLTGMEPFERPLNKEELAARLQISPQTVHTIFKRIQTKMTRSPEVAEILQPYLRRQLPAAA